MIFKQIYFMYTCDPHGNEGVLHAELMSPHKMKFSLMPRICFVFRNGELLPLFRRYGVFKSLTIGFRR